MIVNPVTVDMDVGTPTIVPMTISGDNSIHMGWSDAINVYIRPVDLQDKSVTPTQETQIVVCDPEYTGLGTVTVNPIPNCYGLVTWNGNALTIT